MSKYAIITFRHTGPIKSWAAMRATNVHNARTKPLAHAMPAAPAPKFLVGTNDLVKDVRSALVRADIDPDRLRKNGVIGYEAILTASAAFFDEGAEAEKTHRIDRWAAAQVEWAMKRYGAHRVASMVLHQDEKTPHVHLVIVPLDVKSDGRRNDSELRWSLVGRTISGPGKFDDAQDAYAAAMAPFGLVRGIKGSGRKHEPVPVYLARLAAKERQVDVAQLELGQARAAAATDRQQIGRDLDALQVGFENLALSASKVTEDQAALNARHTAATAALARDAEDQRLSLQRDRDTMNADVLAERRKVAAERAELAKEKAAYAAAVADDDRRLAAERETLRQDQQSLSAARIEVGRAAAKQRADSTAMTRAMQAAVTLQREAEEDRVAAADELTRARTTSAKINEHRAHLLPTLRAAADFRKRIEGLKGQALTPAASATRAALDDLQAAASSVTAPRHEVRPEIIAAYARIQQGGSALGC